MRPRRWPSILFLLLLCLGCRKTGESGIGSGPVQRSVSAGDKHVAPRSSIHTSRVARDDKVKAIIKDEQKRDEPSHPSNNARIERGLGPLVMPVVGEAMFQYRHVLAFQNALSAASLMIACECDVETALRRTVPPDEAKEYREVLRGPLKVISTAMQLEKQGLEKSRPSSVLLLLSVAAVIRRLEEKRGDSRPEVLYQYLPCNEPAAPNDDGRGIAMTVIWDGFPKGVIPIKKLEATVWIQFLVFPGGLEGRENRSQTWNSESRKLRFTLGKEVWISE